MAILPRSTMEDDIDVLSRGNHEFSDDGFTRGDNLSNMHISFTRDEKDGSLHALTTAYSDLKKRYRELESRNSLLTQTIKDMEMQRMTGSRPVSANFGGAAGPASGPAAQGAEMEQAQLRAELSYAQNLERQILRARSTITKLETEKVEWQRKAEAFERDLKRIRTLVQDKDRKIEQLECDLRTRGQGPVPKGRGAYSGLPAEIDDKKYTESDVSKFLAENNKLREENVQLKGYNESLLSRCVALEKGASEGTPSVMSMSLTQDDERFIVDQMNVYRNMIKDLKKQVSVQGDMLQKQKEAIRRLIVEVQTYRAKQSSLPYRTPDGASIHQPIKDGYAPNYTTFQGLENQFPDAHDRFGAGNFQTLNPQTIEPGSRDVGNKASTEAGRTNNLTRRVSSTRLSDIVSAEEGNVPRTISPSAPHGRRTSPDNSSAIDRDRRPPGVSSDTYQPVNSGARSKVLHPPSGSNQDLDLYENIGNVPSPRSPVPSRNQSQGVINVNVEDSRTQLDKFRFGHPVEQEDDYVNINGIQPHRNLSQGRDVSRPSPSNDIRNRQPSSAENVAVDPSSLSSQLCPVCRREFPNISMEDFQMHVISCMDSQDDGDFVTMTNPQGNTGSDNRICPMCEASFPAELPQSEFERHVQEHFGEDPITDRFEVLRP